MKSSNLPNVFHVENVGIGQIEIDNTNPVYEFRPVKFVIKDDGAVDDGPSFGIVGINKSGVTAVMQISAAMFKVAYESMKEVYEVSNQEEHNNK